MKFGISTQIRLRSHTLGLTFFLISLSALSFFGCQGEAVDGVANTAAQVESTPPKRFQAATDEVHNRKSKIADLDFQDSSHVWAIKSIGNRLYRSVDGGEKFRKESTPLGPDASISFIDANIGWVLEVLVGSARIWQTNDGGHVWEKVGNIERFTSQLTAVKEFKFLNASDGWLADIYGIWRSSDGGKSWSRVFDVSTYAGADQVMHATVLTADIVMLATSHGVYVTTNGGKNWTLSVKEDWLTAIYFSDPQNGWIASDAIQTTNDGGKTWQRLCSFGSRIRVRSLYFTDRSNGWVAGEEAIRTIGPASGATTPWQGALFQTTDGGKTWVRQSNPKEFVFFRVQFVDRNRAWLLGNTKLYRTVDGGQTWTTALNPL